MKIQILNLLKVQVSLPEKQLMPWSLCNCPFSVYIVLSIYNFQKTFSRSFFLCNTHDWIGLTLYKTSWAVVYAATVLIHKNEGWHRIVRDFPNHFLSGQDSILLMNFTCHLGSFLFALPRKGWIYLCADFEPRTGTPMFIRFIHFLILFWFLFWFFWFLSF